MTWPATRSGSHHDACAVHGSLADAAAGTLPHVAFVEPRLLGEEIGVSNGTFLNETKLQTGVPVELVDGDHVRFGLVKLIFRAGD